jgi:hypothetical protein
MKVDQYGEENDEDEDDYGDDSYDEEDDGEVDEEKLQRLYEENKN